LALVEPERYRASAFAYVFSGNYDEAASQAEQALQERPNLHVALRCYATANALAGKIKQAQKAMARLRQIDPTLHVSNLNDLTPLCRSEDMAKYSEGMRRAGVPE
jgi:tetratricopeptide (TPR) repeat protein